MQFYTRSHNFYCGIDLHSRKMYLCILNAEGERVFHRNVTDSPEAFLKAIHGAKSKNDRIRNEPELARDPEPNASAVF